jgi:hypothetical protein
MQFEFISKFQGPHVHEIKGFKDVDMVDLARKPKMLIHKIGSSSFFLDNLNMIQFENLISKNSSSSLFLPNYKMIE